MGYLKTKDTPFSLNCILYLIFTVKLVRIYGLLRKYQVINFYPVCLDGAVLLVFSQEFILKIMCLMIQYNLKIWSDKLVSRLFSDFKDCFYT